MEQDLKDEHKDANKSRNCQVRTNIDFENPEELFREFEG
jgi:hypothetical protein